MKIRITFDVRSAATAVALLFAVAIPALADIIVVTNTNDTGPGSLRQALADANDGDTITFAVTGTIGLTSGELLVDKSIIISGPGADNLAVNGNAKSRVFEIGSGRSVSISGMTIVNGDASGDVPDGGGIYNDHATLTLGDCTVSNNSAFRDGGGILNDGAALIVNNCVISSNVTGNDGGGICNEDNGGNASLQITDSVLSTNSAEFGGGICHDGRMGGTATASISNSTLSSNSGGYGGGAIFSIGDVGGATLTINNSTISGNSAPAYGGGIYNHSTLTISNSTLSDSAAVHGGSIYNEAFVWIGNTVLKAGAKGENIFNNGGTITSLGYSLSSDDAGGFLTGPGDQINADPMLGPLQDNGGPTFTHTLLPGSPAIDAGDPSFTPPPIFDQRGPGFDRVVGGRIDIGSFEVQSAGPTPTPTPSPSPMPTPTPTAAPGATPRPRPTPHQRPTPP